MGSLIWKLSCSLSCGFPPHSQGGCLTPCWTRGQNISLGISPARNYSKLNLLFPLYFLTINWLAFIFEEFMYLFKKYLRSYCMSGSKLFALNSLVYSVLLSCWNPISGSCHPLNKVQGSLSHPEVHLCTSQVSGFTICCLHFVSNHIEKLVILCSNHARSCSWAVPVFLFYPTGWLFIWIVLVQVARLRWATDSSGSHFLNFMPPSLPCCKYL